VEFEFDEDQLLLRRILDLVVAHVKQRQPAW
jgi:hypothetical protein